MTRSARAKRRVVIVLFAATFVAAAILSVSLIGGGTIHTEDRDRDGRPDVWKRLLDHSSVVALDTNADGRPDVRLRYTDGDLVSREVDVDFDDRVDVVEEFDPETHEVVRSLFDIDEDGQADLLVLSRSGRPVFEEWAGQRTVTRSVGSVGSAPARGVAPTASDTASDGRSLIPLTDPFAGEVTLRGTRPWRSAHRDSLLTTSGGLPLPIASPAGLTTARRSFERESPTPPHSEIAQVSQRGPPIFTSPQTSL